MDQTQTTQLTGTSPQLPASGLQPTGGTAQPGSSMTQPQAVVEPGAQESLLGARLRVGESQTVIGVSGRTEVANTSSTPIGSPVLLVLLIPLAILIILFWPRNDTAQKQ